MSGTRNKGMEKALAYYREGAEQGEEHCLEALKRLDAEGKASNGQ